MGKRITWEYKSVQDKLTDKQLNKLGQDGWELVAHSAVVVNGMLGSSNELRQYYIFKRPHISSIHP